MYTAFTHAVTFEFCRTNFGPLSRCCFLCTFCVFSRLRHATQFRIASRITCRTFYARRYLWTTSKSNRNKNQFLKATPLLSLKHTIIISHTTARMRCFRICISSAHTVARRTVSTSPRSPHSPSFSWLGGARLVLETQWQHCGVMKWNETIFQLRSVFQKHLLEVNWLVRNTRRSKLINWDREKLDIWFNNYSGSAW